MIGFAISRFWAKFFFLFLLLGTSASAQTHFERISKADRSDGQGYVVRFHFTQPVDSFNVIQPATDLIQVQLYAQNIDTSGIDIPDTPGKIQEIRVYELSDSFGIDIYLAQEVFVTSKIYADGASNDVLLNMSKTDEHSAIVFSQQFLAKTWYEDIESAFEISTVPVPVVQASDNGYSQIADKLKFDTIVIDAGHGGTDPGNIGYKGTYEKKVTLAIALKLGAYIEEYMPDVKVIYTRDEDENILPNASILEELMERGNIANRAGADLFVSIHADAWKLSSVSGSSVFFLGLNRSNKSLEVMKKESLLLHEHGVIENFTEEDLLMYELANSGKIATSERIAYMIEDQLKNRAQRKSRGVKQMGLVVLYQATMPGILVETGFLTNPSEHRFLTSEYGQKIIASAVFRAIRDYRDEFEQSLELSNSSK